MIPYLGAKRVLELGCGPGHLLVQYSSLGGEILGLDASQQMLRQARKNLSRSNQANKLVHGFAQLLPFSQNSFPIIVSTFPSNYIFEVETLEEVWRVLSQDGQLVILLAAWITGDNYLEKFAAWLFRITGESPGQDWDQIKVSYAQPLVQLSKVGFKVSHHIIDADRSKLLLIRAAKSDGFLQ